MSRLWSLSQNRRLSWIKNAQLRHLMQRTHQEQNYSTSKVMAKRTNQISMGYSSSKYPFSDRRISFSSIWSMPETCGKTLEAFTSEFLKKALWWHIVTKNKNCKIGYWLYKDLTHWQFHSISQKLKDLGFWQAFVHKVQHFKLMLCWVLVSVLNLLWDLWRETMHFLAFKNWNFLV